MTAALETTFNETLRYKLSSITFSRHFTLFSMKYPQLLAVYWTSFKPLQMHQLLPPLPCLVELHINRSSILKTKFCEDPPTTAIFPKLLSLYISGDNPRKLSFGDELARLAPNLAYLLFSVSHFSQWVTSSSSNVVSNYTTLSQITIDYDFGDYPLVRTAHNFEGTKHDFYFHDGGIIVECEPERMDIYPGLEALKIEFEKFNVMETTYVEAHKLFEDPKRWQKWWTNQIVGNIRGPWCLLQFPRMKE